MAIEIKPPKIEIVEVEIEGTSPLIVHNWSQKAKQAMLDKQMGKVVRKEKKDPQRDFEESMYRFDDGRHGFPATGFKAATVQAVRLFDGLTLVSNKVAIYVHGETNKKGDQLVEVIAPEPIMREDMVRLERGIADIRFRAQYWPWSAVLKIQYIATLLSQELIINLVETGGYGGVGEWRPSAPKSFTGQYGMYQVARHAQIEVKSN